MNKPCLNDRLNVAQFLLNQARDLHDSARLLTGDFDNLEIRLLELAVQKQSHALCLERVAEYLLYDECRSAAGAVHAGDLSRTLEVQPVRDNTPMQAEPPYALPRWPRSI